jgi:signal transduction histidine kinase
MRGANQRILLIDDDPDDRSLASVVLTSELGHFEVHEVPDAVTFAQACARRDFDLVILEQKLHWADGLAVLGALKEEWPELPVILFTRSGNEELALKAARLGVHQYLVKRPGTFLRLASEVEAALLQTRARIVPPAGRREPQLAAVPREAPEARATDLDRFAAVASHELQEPARAIERALRALRDEHGGGLDDAGRALVERAAAAAGRLQDMVRDLLSLSQVEGEPRELVDVDAGELLEQALGNLEAAIAESGAKVTHAPLPTIHADPVQIVQLLQNLIGNAIKFHGDRPPAVHVAAARTDGEWVFSVHDNGVGMEPVEAESIFTSFKRLRPEVPGSGLGLSICKRVVERHGGHIWVKSEPGQGSTFYFTLPRAAEQERPQGGTPFARRRSF